MLISVEEKQIKPEKPTPLTVFQQRAWYLCRPATAASDFCFWKAREHQETTLLVAEKDVLSLCLKLVEWDGGDFTCSPVHLAAVAF